MGKAQPGGIVQPGSGDFKIRQDLVITDLQGNVRIRLDKDTGSIFVFDENRNIIFLWEVPGHNLRLGGHGSDGDLLLFSASKRDIRTIANNQATFYLSSDDGILMCGGGGVGGQIVLRNSGNPQSLDSQVININANERVFQIKSGEHLAVNISGEGLLRLGSRARSGRIELFSDEGTNTIALNAEDGAIRCTQIDTDRVIGNVRFDNINCSGDITLANGDCAEDFEVEEDYLLQPGSVVVLNENGKLQPCLTPYDRKVAGIVAGAGDTKPGIILGRKSCSANKLPVALIGKVYCNVDATESPIEVGDLLTTSSISGFAMKAMDPLKAFGAIIGKALAPISGGKGLIPVLVSLQ